jgi:hypothetical protein
VDRGRQRGLGDSKVAGFVRKRTERRARTDRLGLELSLTVRRQSVELIEQFFRPDSRLPRRVETP